MSADFSKYFNTAATRAEAAEAVYTSPEFLDVARQSIRRGIIQNGSDSALVREERLDGFSPRMGDEKYLEGALKTLRQEFPDVVSLSIYCDFGVSAVQFCTRLPAPQVQETTPPVPPPRKPAWKRLFGCSH